MKIEIKDLSKSYGDKLIFKNLSTVFFSDRIYGISGLNGSGKSTFLKIISGYTSPSAGSVSYSIENQIIDREKIHEHLSFIAPYIDIPLDYTFSELLNFHFTFRKRYRGIDNLEIESNFNFPEDKSIRKYSSGMLQRVKLALAFFTDSRIVLLDEPTETLDEQGYSLYTSLIDKYAAHRVIIISSNKERDFYKTKEIINIENYKVKL